MLCGTSPCTRALCQSTQHRKTIMDRQGDEIHVTTEEARSGRTGLGVFQVLMISLALIVVAYGVVWLAGSFGPDQSGQAAESSVSPAPAAT